MKFQIKQIAAIFFIWYIVNMLISTALIIPFYKESAAVFIKFLSEIIFLPFLYSVYLLPVIIILFLIFKKIQNTSDRIFWTSFLTALYPAAVNFIIINSLYLSYPVMIYYIFTFLVSICIIPNSILPSKKEPALTAFYTLIFCLIFLYLNIIYIK